MAIDVNDYFPQAEFRYVLGRIKRVLGDLKVIDAADVAALPTPLFPTSLAANKTITAADWTVGGVVYDPAKSSLLLQINANGITVALPNDASRVLGCTVAILKTNVAVNAFTIDGNGVNIQNPRTYGNGGTYTHAADAQMCSFVYTWTGVSWQLLSLPVGKALISGDRLVDAAVTLAKQANLAGYSIPGVAGASAAVMAALTAAADGHVLRRVAGVLGFGLLGRESLSSTHRTFTCTGGALSTGGVIGLVVGAIDKGGWAAIASNQQQVPSAGDYEADFSGVFASNQTTNPMQVEVGLYKNGVEVGRWSSFRFSATASTNVSFVTGAHLFFSVTTPASELLDLRVIVGAGTADPQDATLRFSLRKVGP